MGAAAMAGAGCCSAGFFEHATRTTIHNIRRMAGDYYVHSISIIRLSIAPPTLQVAVTVSPSLIALAFATSV